MSQSEHNQHNGCFLYRVTSEKILHQLWKSNFKHFLDRSVQGRKAQTGYTALIKAPTHEIQNTEPRPDHNTGNSMFYSLREVCGFFNVPC